ncbi:MAG: DUF3883 domain-containing protein [Flavobacteriales bacterium]|nr:DUF3883 domain-containing protein [Flavobacteriales bacterium]
MNKEIRKFLIDQCVLGQPVYYEDVAKIIDLDLSLLSDRELLSKTLGEISAYEYENGRPLISSVAIYKTANDHGNGFYKLCEELGIGSSSALRKEYYGFSELEKSKIFWKDEFNYEQFYSLAVPLYNDSDNPFFNIDEIAFFRKWIYKVYDKNNRDHYSAKEYLLDTVWAKTRFLSNEIVNRLDNYETSNKRMWSKRDWQEGKRVSTFKPYTWARIYKNGNKSKEIFFTVGIDPENNSFLYKLDYYHENDSNLSTLQKELCRKHIPDSLRWNEIHENDLINWNWESLIKKMVDFIAENSHHYDQLVELVWGDTKSEEVFTNNLTLRQLPEGGLVDLPKLNPKFEGVDTDFIKKSANDKELGDFGEELVLDYEKKKLSEKGLYNFVDKVKIVKDGNGYDIKSFDENGNDIFIEVKTTQGNSKTPFYLSLNEKLFFEKERDKYFIYRLYNFDSERNYADFFIIVDINKRLLFQPTEYRVYLKKN